MLRFILQEPNSVIPNREKETFKIFFFFFKIEELMTMTVMMTTKLTMREKNMNLRNEKKIGRAHV